MRSVCLVALLLAGCSQPTVYSSLCDMNDEFRGWEGAQVRVVAMLQRGSMEHPPSVIDIGCWRGIAADTANAPPTVEAAFARAGRFTDVAIVTGRITSDGDRAWLRITAIDALRIGPPKSPEQQDAFFRQMVRDRNAYYRR